MSAPPLPHGARLRRRLILHSASLTLFAIAVISLYLALLIQLPAEQWRGFAQIVAVLFAILFALATALNARWVLIPMLRCLDRVAEGSAGQAEIRRGFAAVANFPRTSFASGCLEWLAGSAAVGLAMYVRYPEVSAFTAVVIFLGGASGGLISVIGFYFIAKRELEPVRLGLAARLPDPEARHALVREVSLRRKLLVSVTAVTLVTGVFALCYARVESGRFLEKYLVSIQHRFLARVAGELRPRGTPDPGAVRRLSEWLGAPSHLLLLDSRGRRIGHGSADALTPGELREIRRRGLARGGSSDFDSPHIFAWVRLPEDGRILVSVVPWSALAAAQEWSTLELGTLLAVFTVLALAVAWLAAEDVGRATRALRSSAARVAAGDLRAAPAFDSEDELGALSLRFEQMAQALRSAVVQLTATADGVESAASGIAASTGRVVQANAEQAAHIERASVTTERIHVEVRGVAESAQRLTHSTESASSSILEIGVTGGQLAQSARALASRVDEVFGAIEGLSSSGRQISDTTQTLASAAEETSGSMEEMAGSVLQVDRHAEDVRQLAERTVAMAESGRSRVLDTIRGMEAIREATEVAQRVIGDLGERSKQIGAIVNVIDDVADETGLLALNAAIIAAQAGENGRAFSVVADEIRNLADRVLRSTKEIAEVISGLQAESANAVGAIERGAGSVRSGVALSVEAGDSLEEITASARESGARIAEIAAVMREQTQSARHVVGLMERVRRGVGEIRSAGDAGRRGHEGLLRSASAMRDVALQVEAATAEQSRGLATIRDGSESVRAAVEEIDAKLRVQSHACGEAADLLERVSAETRSNEESAASIGAAMRDLRERARRLREDVGRFRV